MLLGAISNTLGQFRQAACMVMMMVCHQYGREVKFLSLKVIDDRTCIARIDHGHLGGIVLLQ